MVVSGAWYSSGTFWTGAGVVVALVVGLATVVVTYLTRFARQRLEYGLRTIASLLDRTPMGCAMTWSCRVARRDSVIASL